jgi:FecR protein
MAYTTATEGGFGVAATVIQPDRSHSESISIPDAELLFRGDFHRAGPDLVLTGQDGRHHIIPGYFSTENHPALVAPNGASLSADLVDLLAGSPAPGQYAQAQPTAHADAIGKVEKVVGDVTVMRNGVSVALHVGDVVYKSDVIHTGGNSSAGIGFPDGTALDLVANTRMALNEYSFEPNASTNGALFTLVEGGFAFVAGQVAHTGGVTGGMKIATPVATMGIRGTAGYALQQVATISADVGNVKMTFAVVADPGTDHVGAYTVIDQYGNEVAVNAAGVWTTLSWNGTNPPTVTQLAMTPADFAIEQQLVPELVQLLNNLPIINDLKQTPIPQSPGSSTPPNQLNDFQQLLQQNNGHQFVLGPITIPSGTSVPPVVTISESQSIPPSQNSTTNDWVGQSNGPWGSSANWSGGVPTGQQTAEIDQPVTVTLNQSESAGGLVIGPGAILDIVSGGSLTVASGISNSGIIELDSSGGDPILSINGQVFLLDGGEIEMLGSAASNMIIGVASTGATLVNVNNTIIGSGTIGQGDGNLTLVNGSAGTIEAKPLLGTDTGILVIDTGNVVSNSGLLEAAAGGTLQIEDNVANFGTIAANAGGIVNIDSVTISNAGGLIEAIGAVSVLTINVNTLTNELGATIESGHGGNLTITELASGSTNQGTFEAVDGGMFTIDELGNATNELSGVIEAINGGTLTIDHSDTATNFGMIEALAGGTVTLNDNTSEQNHGTLTATDGGTLNINLVTLSGSGTGGNFGTFEAISGGTVSITGGNTNESGATIEAIGYGSTVDFSNNLEGAAFENLGTILAQNGGTVSFNDVTISSGPTEGGDGTLEADGGKVFVSSDSTLEGVNPINVVITGGGLVDFADSINHIVDVTFGVGVAQGSGTLELDVPPSTMGIPVRVTGFGEGDTIDLTNLPYTTTTGETVGYDTEHHVLTVTDGDTTEKFTLNGTYTPDDFVRVSDPFGGTEVVFGAVDSWNSSLGGDWNPGEWNNGLPGTLNTAEILMTSGSIVVTLNDEETVGNLLIGAGVSLDIVNSGSLVVLNALDDSGLIDVESTGGAATLQVDGPVRIDGSATIEVSGSAAAATFSGDQIGNAGTMSAQDGGTISFIGATVFNQGEGATITADGSGAVVDLSNATIHGGTLETSSGGLVQTVSDAGAGTISTLDGVTIADGTEIQVSDNTALVLTNTIDNQGTITLVGASDRSSLLIDHAVTLTGGGDIVLAGPGGANSDSIGGAGPGATLDNVDNAISGGGTIGSGDGHLTLTNGGTIDANVSGETITVDTGNAMANTGTLEASNGGTLLIDDVVNNSGEGNALIVGGILDFVAASNVNEITFNNGGDTPAYGELIVGAPNGFTATIEGFAGTAHNLAHSDGIDLAGVWTVESETTSGTTVMLDLQDGNGHDVDLTFDDFTGTLNVATDGHGGTLITDPPAGTTGGSPSAAAAIANTGLNFGNDQISLAPGETEMQSVDSRTGSVSVGGPGNDNFVFHPGIGADTIANFNPQADTIQLDNFANVQNVQQLALLITADVHGAAVIDLGHHDSITLPGVTASYLQAHLQSLVHLG